MNKNTTTVRRGRPPKIARDNADTKALLIRTGLETLTEFGFSATGLDTILKKASVPKGSFYHYFKSKEAYGIALVDAYDSYFIAKLSHYLEQQNTPPLERIVNFTQSAIKGMSKYDYKRGCLVGNLNQELNHLSDEFKDRLMKSYTSWQIQIEKCLNQAKQQGTIAKTVNTQLMSEYFWIGWEGAVMRAKLTKSSTPLTLYTEMFLRALLT
ncbi:MULTISPECIES: TetR/AcrR family transcriptional regulator [unclassified Pseudoalteromonas]|jgi:TetR/AcrR family transcriptional repressor of nem operon|uniref:acrylate utilization transcriptional regulator AcuR n=1 Tax=unclassified Pseudoalteromonas TaxID=194690 RepID=UPI0007309DC6|nr:MULTISPECIES: TetR/AcrR family transcriptional regulator [unclassified Pseudoalteromonas]KTD98175.1 TetR family transcriptional regulator [Pseudoalteromonas sp. H71]MBW4965736.1 TetR/AcrR family transcriptional regulator [Pseudoalteromonas sp. CR1]TMN82872.1 TetR family transcriptional regulator [Pseudoalteromonas sp. S410]TMN90313.1 TetR family transcriptional regulator [Pseudoalteromonas sp. S408]TMO00876.1 TetR family transcriptional regulator [Pseudoalteromonas sp. S407]|tara:strand:- start:175 stop:807 length:633 start_codon:yes stop_codon:yes gene_type:complete